MLSACIHVGFMVDSGQVFTRTEQTTSNHRIQDTFSHNMSIQLSTPRTSYTNVALFVLTSVVVHAIGVWMLSLVPPGGPAESMTMQSPEASEQRETSVRMVDEASLPRELQRAQKTLDKKKKKKPEEKKKKQEPRPDDMLPFVTQDRLIREEQPDKANYSGRQAQRTERDMQRKAKPGGTPLNQPLASRITKGTPSGIDTPKAPQQPSEKPEPSKSTREELEAPSDKPDIVLPGGAPSKEPVNLNELVKEEATLAPKRGLDEGVDTGKSAQQNLFPSKAQTAEFLNEIGDNGTFHYLQDVEEGDRTLLNQKRNRYWSFWDRMVRSVRREWKPQKALRQRDPYGNVYGVRNFYTSVSVTLNFDGSIQKLRIAHSSEVDFMDDEAVRALLEAGPFPNPPEGLRDEDGLIHFKFGFNLEIVSGEVKLFNIKPEDPF